jgi:nitrogen regulatory protein PII
MYLVVIVLNEIEHLETLLQEFKKAGVKGVTIIESAGMGRTLKELDYLQFPLVVGAKSLGRQESLNNKTLFSVVETEAMVERIKRTVRRIVGDLSQPNKGILFVVRLEDVVGLAADE